MNVATLWDMVFLMTDEEREALKTRVKVRIDEERKSHESLVECGHLDEVGANDIAKLERIHFVLDF
jgi:hypothetical protein